MPPAGYRSGTFRGTVPRCMRETAVMADRGVQQVLRTQLVLLGAACIGFAVGSGTAAALSALYGGAITLVATWWMARSIRLSATLAARHAGQGARALYGGLAQKYAFVVAALALGMGVLGLKALAMLVGFAVTHAGYLAAAAGRP